ncbi:MAG: benzoate/H(+) symporter BenE family transporter [Aestuariivirgaceae bacterium]
MRLSVISTALTAVLVGFGGSVAIVLAAAQAVGATDIQTSSWVAALCLAMAGTSTLLGWMHRMPIITAWSTPGAALIASTTGIGIEAAVGAFVVVAALIIFTALIRPLGDLIARIPATIASAMLAGVLIQFVIAVFGHLTNLPMLVVPLLVLFFIVRLFDASLAVLGVLGAGITITFALGLNTAIDGALGLSQFELVVPRFDSAVLIGLALPLYLVTMASQNLPGFAVLRAAGYEPPVRSSLLVTGIASLLTAPLGAHTSNLAAITAAICTGPDTHPDPARRWPASIFYGAFYLLLAIFGAALVAIMLAMPKAFIATVAGLALLGPLTGALAAAMKEPEQLTPAVVTFVVTASGLSMFGIGSAFWGLAAGLAILGLDKATGKNRT